MKVVPIFGAPLDVGERVRLNSGSPEMVVISCTGYHATVAWLDNAGEVCRDTFPVGCLYRDPCESP